MTTIVRETRETRIELALRADAGPAAGEAAAASDAEIATGEPFLDHMLRTLARFAAFQLRVEASGDLRHHLVEDAAIALGLALRDETPDRCVRFGHAVVPMDDALVEATVDAGGRAYYEGPIPSALYDHFLRSFASNAGMTLHVRVLRGRDRHHQVEAAFKAVGLALRKALVRGDVVFSTKGAVRLEIATGGAEPPPRAT